MLRKSIVLLGALIVATGLSFEEGKAQQTPAVKQIPMKQTSAASGKEMFGQYCAPCHGVGGKGAGPAASALKAPPPDLTQLARKNNGRYPSDTVAGVLKFGSGPGVHGSADMPLWGPLFQSLDKSHNAVVQQRISNLVSYIETLQVK